MSTVQELASRLRATAERLPADTVISAADRLTVATELLAWVRRSSPHPMGVPHLGTAVEHLENAVRSLRAVQDGIEEYLGALGLAGIPISDATGEIVRRHPRPSGSSPEGDTDRSSAPQLSHWWIARVDTVTEMGDGSSPRSGNSGAASRSRDPKKIGNDSIALLQAVATEVKDDDRRTLRERLRDADPPVGLGLSVVSPPALRRLATEYLGKTPDPQDRKQLLDLTGSPLRSLLPGLDAAIHETLIDRLCQVPPDQRKQRKQREQRGQAKQQPEGWENVDHPADLAIAHAVLVGLLLHRLGKTPDLIDRELTRSDPTDARGGNAPDPKPPGTAAKGRANA